MTKSLKFTQKIHNLFDIQKIILRNLQLYFPISLVIKEIIFYLNFLNKIHNLFFDKKFIIFFILYYLFVYF
jgi:hypothetical protein